MKPWTINELDNVVSTLQPLIGLRVQEVQTTERDCVLGFYYSQGILWLWIDLHAIHPGLLPWAELPLRPEVQKTPLQLFLRAHFVGRTLRAIARPSELGRVVVLRFGQEPDQLEIEIRLFPHGRNLLATCGKKHIAWMKPKELVSSAEVEAPTATLRTLEDLREQWLRDRGGSKSAKNAPSSIKTKLEQELAKKEKALVKVQDELRRKQELPWRLIGDWLKTNQSLDVPKEWVPFVDRRRKLAWNIEQCFTKAREGDAKMYGTEKRIVSLSEEIAKIQERLLQPEASLTRPEPSTKAQPNLAKIKAQARTLHLSDGTMAVMGKSAADNLKILRKARAWDLWFHMRDYPSSHAILFRNKGSKVSDERLFEVAGWFVRNHLGQKAAQHGGEKFDVVVVESRYVRPVKGDKIGRVTYHDERVLIYQFPG